MNKYFVLLFFFLSMTIKSQAQETNISNGVVFEGEPFIAINPNNSQNMVVAWMGYVYGNSGRLSIKIKATFNGGKTWSNAKVLPHIISTYKSADVSMAFDGKGKLFLSFIDYREGPDSGGVYLLKSIDGGLGWSNPVKLIDAYSDGAKRPIDRPWLSVNSAGDKLYLTTKPAPWVLAPNRPYFLASNDSGKNWSTWRYLDTTNYLVGNLIQGPMAAPTAIGNVFFAAYPSYLTSQSVFARFLLAKTTNMGKSFSYSVILAGTGGANNDTAKLGYKLLANPSNPNHLVFVYCYQPFGDIDIMMTESKNGGVNWTLPLRINDDAQGNGKMQDLVWADFSPKGDLAISWRDRRNGVGTGYKTASEFYSAVRLSDSVNFLKNSSLSSSSVSYNAILEQSGNDFMGIVYTKDTISAVWGSTKDGSLDIWFVRKLALSGKIVDVALVESESFELKVFPNPTSDKLIVDLSNSSDFKTEIFTLNSELILKSKNQKIIDISNLPNGIYLVKVFSKNKISSQKVVISK